MLSTFKQLLIVELFSKLQVYNFFVNNVEDHNWSKFTLTIYKTFPELINIHAEMILKKNQIILMIAVSFTPLISYYVFYVSFL